MGVMLGSEQDPSIDDLRGRLERSPERLADGKGAECVIADARTDEFVGAVNLFALGTVVAARSVSGCVSGLVVVAWHRPRWR